MMATCALNSTYIPLFLPSLGPCSSGDSIHSCIVSPSSNHVNMWGESFLTFPSRHCPLSSFALVSLLPRITCISFSTHPSLTSQPTAVCLLLPLTISTLHSQFFFLKLILVSSSSVNRYHMCHWLHSETRQ